jgi:hypothetical protein
MSDSLVAGLERARANKAAALAKLAKLQHVAKVYPVNENLIHTTDTDNQEDTTDEECSVTA